ncbi:MAG: MFS transporter [Gammaproteobacteria bacterium]|nr:MFS transporter [Gammaproteobacteria bacterium]MBU2057974.1 MFS transporter [Gammaproteobacteria bacterium]MBU2174326.1 MFS transporter [Gammaproteobacteria bacterium]MBU2247723.1 MFS transporter [Gammaproteobacteria bacterium]MBU2344249.1 MFS transporter [Gammaproteobacteria bacterium]
MSNILRSFSSLYFATLLMVLASGVLTTYLGLRLAADSAAQIWIGGMMSAYYLGLVAGSKIGHRLIARVGHIRAFVASAGITTASALGHALIEDLAIWLVLRLMVGMGMMCMYMVLESWLNEQADSKNRGTVFASYMIVSYLGLVLGQLAISLSPELTLKPLLIVAMCFALCIVPLALTRRIHPAPLQPAPLKIKLFWQKVPQSLTTIAMAGVIVGSFYGLAPAYIAHSGASTEQVAAYMATTVVAGLVAQWPMGRLSDKIKRSRLIRTNTVLLGIVVLCIAILPLSGILQLIFTFAFGILAFTLYPLATALANQNVEQEHRVALSATILLTFGMGACIGPLIASTFMQMVGNSMLYGFMALCTLLLFLRLTHVNYQQKQQNKEVPQDYVMASGDLVSSPLAAALDPRVDEQMVQEQMVQPHLHEADLPTADQELSSMESETEAATENETVEAEAVAEAEPDKNAPPETNKPA